MTSSADGKSIGQVAKATGLSEGVLRAWERRHGFPVPDRGRNGHRRYSDEQVAQIRRVDDQRSSGVPLATAIERIVAASGESRSFFAGLRERHPTLRTMRVSKRHLLALAHSVEDESAARAERPLLIGGFQRERFYRAGQERWRELSAGASHAFVFADFARRRSPRGGPVEIPIRDTDPAIREWVLVCLAPEHSICLVGWEPPARKVVEDLDRPFEVLLSVRPEVVRDAVRVAGHIAGQTKDGEAIRDYAEQVPDPNLASQLDLSAAVTVRLLGELR
jgi:MerR family transcriptional regulator, light-induced transcriptional regulator